MTRYMLITLVALPALLLTGLGCEGMQANYDWTPTGEEDVWAIRCVTLRGPQQLEQAEAYAEALRSVRGLRPDLVKVMSDADGTAVFYGRYRRMYGAESGKDMYKPNHLRDLERIKSLRFQGQNVWPFILATMDVLPTYRSEHGEWDLTDVQAYWSLQIGVFYNTETMQSRRSAAEEFCRILREQGEEAYFHHGAVNSSVCIGAYPKQAVQRVQKELPLAGRVVSTMQIVDPRMQEAQRRFPICLHNGHERFDIQRDPQTGEVAERIPTPSFAVLTPYGQRQQRETGG